MEYEVHYKHPALGDPKSVDVHPTREEAEKSINEMLKLNKTMRKPWFQNIELFEVSRKKIWPVG